MIDRSKNQTLLGQKRNLMTNAINNKQQNIGSEMKENFQNQHLHASMPMYFLQEAFNVGFLKEAYIPNAIFLK